MTTITLDIPEEHLKLLSQRASLLGIATEDLTRLSIADVLMCPAPDVQQAIDYEEDE